MRRESLAILTSLVVISFSQAQAPEWRFRWSAGQVLTYKVDHVTTVTQTVDKSRTQTSVKLQLVKRWEVVAVDAAGVATVRMSLQAMRSEQKRPDGEVLLFDSANLDKSTPELREQLGKYVGKSLAELRIDATGKVLETKLGQASRYEAEPPFLIVLPASPVAVGGRWDRHYHITLEPPLGTGEKYPATQKYECKSITGPLAALTLTTQFSKLPENPGDRIPLLQRQPEGEIVFDLQQGRLHSARLTINHTLENHQGHGSSYHFQSSYSEQLWPQ